MKCRKLSINLLVLRLLILMTVSSFLLSCTSQEEKIKREFIKIVESRLEQLKTENLQKKQKAECKGPENQEVMNSELKLALMKGETLEEHHFYHAVYCEYDGTYSYDIQKTSSLVSPYTGVVTYNCTCFEKSGHNEEDCLKSSWSTSILGEVAQKQRFAYQNNKWILKSGE